MVWLVGRLELVSWLVGYGCSCGCTFSLHATARAHTRTHVHAVHAAFTAHCHGWLVTGYTHLYTLPRCGCYLPGYTRLVLVVTDGLPGYTYTVRAFTAFPGFISHTFPLRLPVPHTFGCSCGYHAYTHLVGSATPDSWFWFGWFTGCRIYGSAGHGCWITLRLRTRGSGYVYAHTTVHTRSVVRIGSPVRYPART